MTCELLNISFRLRVLSRRSSGSRSIQTGIRSGRARSYRPRAVCGVFGVAGNGPDVHATTHKALVYFTTSADRPTDYGRDTTGRGLSFNRCHSPPTAHQDVLGRLPVTAIAFGRCVSCTRKNNTIKKLVSLEYVGDGHFSSAIQPIANAFGASSISYYTGATTPDNNVNWHTVCLHGRNLFLFAFRIIRSRARSAAAVRGCFSRPQYTKKGVFLLLYFFLRARHSFFFHFDFSRFFRPSSTRRSIPSRNTIVIILTLASGTFSLLYVPGGFSNVTTHFL